MSENYSENTVEGVVAESIVAEDTTAESIVAEDTAAESTVAEDATAESIAAEDAAVNQIEKKGYKPNIEERFCIFLERWPGIHELYVKYEELLVYLVVGVLTTIVALGAKFIFNAIFYQNTAHPTSVQNLILSTVNWVAGVTFAYFANRKYVFRSHGPMLTEAVKFVMSRVSTWILDIVVMQVLGNLMGINLLIATLVSVVLVTIANYVFSKLFVFRKKSN